MIEIEILDIIKNKIDNEISISEEISVENGFDSLTLMEIIVEIEDKFDILLDDYILRINEAENVENIISIIKEVIENKSNKEIEIEDSIAKESEKEYIYINNKQKKYLKTNEIIDKNYIVKMNNGGISFNGITSELYEYFDSVFYDIARINNAIGEKYPILLSSSTLHNTSFEKNHPNFSLYTEEGDVVLSPSACFHVYEKYSGKEIKDDFSVTFIQSVIRTESKTDGDEFGRLNDYHVREVVFIGSENHVNESIDNMIELTKQFIEKIGLVGSIESASDMFVTPIMQRYKMVQLHKKAKYEIRLNYAADKLLSVASFNRHGKAFTIPFNIKVSGVNNVVSGCVGYGIERWVLAFISQYGYDLINYPDCVKEFLKNKGFK